MMHLRPLRKKCKNVITSVNTLGRKMNPETYSGKVTAIGNSTGIRFDSALFKLHPEFSGDIRATIVADGHMLVSAKPYQTKTPDESEDTVMLAFLRFIEKDMLDHPENIAPLDTAQMDRIASLVVGVETD